MKSLTEILEAGYQYESWIQNPKFTNGTLLSDLDQKRNMALTMAQDMPWLDEEAFSVYLRSLMEESYDKLKERYNKHTKFGVWCITHGYNFPPKDQSENFKIINVYKEASHTDQVHIFISVPMSGRNQTDVINDLNRAMRYIINYKKELDYEYDEIIFKADAYKKPKLDYEPRLECLGEDIKILGECNACFFCVGWKESKGCNIEREVCKQYGIRIIDEPV